MQSLQQRTSARRGFTLVEMLIVLAVLSVLVALSWPSLRGLLAKNELRSAAKQLRAALVQARLDAMESGALRQLRYRPGTGRFEVTAVGGEEKESATKLVPPAPLEEAKSKKEKEQTLPADIRFEKAGEKDLAPSPVLPTVSDGQDQSPAVLFYPNGRTSNARFKLVGQNGYQIEVALRGLTGAVAIAQVAQAKREEAKP